MGVSDRRRREREARRSAVLGATRRLVRERGFNATTTRQIAEECELSEATLFWYFKSKDEIFTSLLFEGIDFMGSGLDRIAALDLSSRDRLSHIWRFFCDLRTRHPEYLHVFSYLAHPASTASVSDEVKSEIARRSGQNFRRFAEILRADGTGEREARVAADLLWGAFVGLTVLHDSRANLGAGQDAELDVSAQLDVLLSGIAPKSHGNGGGKT